MSYAPAERPAAPKWAGTTLDGKRIDLADYRGKVVVVNAWAYTCGPCRLEAPGLSRVNDAMADQGVAVIGMNTDTNAANARAFQRDKKLSFPSLYDPSGRKLLELPEGVTTPTGIPYTLFLDRRARIAALHVGAVAEKDVKKIVTPLLKEPAHQETAHGS